MFKLGKILDFIKEFYLCFILEIWEYFLDVLFEDKDIVNVLKCIFNYNGEKLL